jgi:DNA-directed RNA polymerase specialized sigma24 family protein
MGEIVVGKSQYDVVRAIMAALGFDRRRDVPQADAVPAVFAGPPEPVRAAGRRRAVTDEVEQLLVGVRERGLTQHPVLGDVVRRILELVSAADAALLRARYLEGRSPSELAERAGLSPRVVDAQLAWARARLQDELVQRLDLIEDLGARLRLG